jgi:hypothetical protein
VAWVHPTWRDLVIDELATSAKLRRHFLAHCGVHGVVLALSTEGGRAGARHLPLLREDADWDTLGDRVHALVPALEPVEQTTLMTALERVIDVEEAAPVAREASAVARLALSRIAGLWEDSRSPVSLPVIEAWLSLSTRLESPLAPTWLSATWAELLPVQAPAPTDRAEVQRLVDWLTLCELLVQFSRTLPNRLGLDQHSVAVIGDFLDLVAVDLEGAASELVLRALDSVEVLVPDLGPPVNDLRRHLLHVPPGSGAGTQGAEDYWSLERGDVVVGGFDVSRVLADL